MGAIEPLSFTTREEAVLYARENGIAVKGNIAHVGVGYIIENPLQQADSDDFDDDNTSLATALGVTTERLANLEGNHEGLINETNNNRVLVTDKVDDLITRVRLLEKRLAAVE